MHERYGYGYTRGPWAVAEAHTLFCFCFFFLSPASWRACFVAQKRKNGKSSLHNGLHTHGGLQNAYTWGVAEGVRPAEFCRGFLVAPEVCTDGLNHMYELNAVELCPWRRAPLHPSV